jgi:hypothetical protein
MIDELTVMEEEFKSLWSTLPRDGSPIAFKYIIKRPNSRVGKYINRPQYYEPLIYRQSIMDTDHNSQGARCSQHYTTAFGCVTWIRW